MMSDVYSFVDAIESFPDKLVSLEDTIQKILKQTIECMVFIHEYCGLGFGGQFSVSRGWSHILIGCSGRLLRDILSDTTQIDGFMQEFGEPLIPSSTFKRHSFPSVFQPMWTQ
jgi:hypothetical protein